MNNRERAVAVLNYKEYDRLPVVHFGYWNETLIKWANEGHISMEDALNWQDNTPSCQTISSKLGFDFNWYNTFPTEFTLLWPVFESKVIREDADGGNHVMNSDGVVVLQKNDAGSIPSEIAHSLKDRKSWEELYKPKLIFNPERMARQKVNTGKQFLDLDGGGMDFLRNQDTRENPLGLMVGSLLGRIRDWLGVVGLSYIMFDDEPLLDEIIETVWQLCYDQAEYILSRGARFDFAHYWEDICFKNGPLVQPEMFHKKIGPYYGRLTKLLNEYGITIISLDCDGYIDFLIPTWIENGVNTMFPIEVGTWNANIRPWRGKYGKNLRGVGGMNKVVFSQDFAAIDAEIDRLKPLVELGGYIPCPDHRIPPDAKWDNVRYYCDKMHN